MKSVSIKTAKLYLVSVFFQTERLLTPELENLHNTVLEIPPIFTSIPASLFFDVTFLEFFMGERMFPWNRKGFITQQELFPTLTMPRFKVMCLIRKKDNEKWTIDYRCTCDRPDTLFCASLAAQVIKDWKDGICRYLNHMYNLDGTPAYNIPDMTLVSNVWQGYEMWSGKFDPIICFHYIFTHRHIRNNYAVGRINKQYRVLANPRYFTYKIRNCLETLSTVKHKLPFTFQIDCYPYYTFTPFKPK